MVSPVKVIGDVGPSAVAPGVQLTKLFVIALPPFAGVVNEIVAWALPGTKLVIVGVAGAMSGVTNAAPDDGPLPALLCAVTVHE